MIVRDLQKNTMFIHYNDAKVPCVVYCFHGDCNVFIATSSLEIINEIEAKLIDIWRGIIELPITNFDYIRAKRRGLTNSLIKTQIQKCYFGPCQIKSNAQSSIRAFISEKRKQMMQTKKYKFIEKPISKCYRSKCVSNYFKDFITKYNITFESNTVTYFVAISRLHFFHHIFINNYFPSSSIHVIVQKNSTDLQVTKDHFYQIMILT